MEPTITEGFAGGSHVTDGPLTTSLMREAAPGLLLNDVDRRVARVRPMATPVDQISRLIGARQCKSMIVDYYSVDTKKQAVTFTGDSTLVAGATYDGLNIYSFNVADAGSCAVSDTLLVPDVSGYDEAGLAPVDQLMLYVVGIDDNKTTVRVVAVNGAATGGKKGVITVNLRGHTAVRMGRAAAELDVQTPQFEALPRKSSNFCQIFKAQVEQSGYAKLAAKEVGWDFTDQEEVAVMDMRMGMEKSFVFGSKARIQDPKNHDDVLFTKGIWHQAEGHFEFETGAMSQDTLIDMMRCAFTGENSGSSRKILLAGSGLICAINKLDYTKVVNSTQTVARWGIDFNELRSKFGTLYVVHAEIFDQCGHADDGLIIDPAYMVKYTHVPFKVENLDLKSSGVRNTQAVVITEASCLVLRHPKSHIRVVAVAPQVDEEEE